MNYVPVNKEYASEFEERLEKSPLFRGTDNFITLYNNNLINKNNAEIEKVAKEITEVYKNVSLINRKFFVKSKEEVISEEFEVLFPHIAFVANLKRVATDILSDNYPNDTKIVFTEAEQNVVHIMNEEGEIVAYEGAEKLKNANKMIATNPFLINNLEMEPYGEDGEGISFKAVDLLEIDTSFITEIGELLEAYVQK